MAVTRVQSAIAPGGPTTPLTCSFSSLPGAGNCVIVATAPWNNGGGRDVTSITDNQGVGNTYTRLGSAQTAGSNAFVDLWICQVIGATSGTFTVTVDYTNIVYAQVVLVEYSGVHHVDVTGNAGGTSNTAAKAITTTVSSCMLIACMCADYGSGSHVLTPAADTPTTIREQESSAITFDIEVCEGSAPTIGTYTAQVGIDASLGWGIVVAALTATGKPVSKKSRNKLGTRIGVRQPVEEGVVLLKQSTAYTRSFLMIDSADHVSNKTGLTVTVTLSKAGGAFGAAGGTVSEVGNGVYKIALTTTDTNTLGDLAYHCTASGADPTDIIDQVSARIEDDLAFPTTTGRSLDVTATGAAGIDWGNVENPTTTVGLSGTTVKTATDVETDTQDIQGRLPAALVSGRVDASVGAMAANTLTAAALASDAGTEIGAAVLASVGAVRANTAQSGDATHIQLDAGASAVDDAYNGLLCMIVGGTGEGQVRYIADYVGSTKTALVATWTVIPNNTSVFILVGA